MTAKEHFAEIAGKSAGKIEQDTENAAQSKNKNR